MPDPTSYYILLIQQVVTCYRYGLYIHLICTLVPKRYYHVLFQYKISTVCSYTYVVILFPTFD